jgi:hypothetical protein
VPSKGWSKLGHVLFRLLDIAPDRGKPPEAGQSKKSLSYSVLHIPIMSVSTKMTRYYIRHPDDPEIKIAGYLEQLEPELQAQGRKVALVRT